MKSFLAAIVSLLLCGSALLPAQNSTPRILRAELATINGGEVVLAPEPETARIISPGAVLYDADKKFSPDDFGGVEVQVSGSTTAELELIGIYNGTTRFVMARRPAPASDSMLRWAVPQIDQFTSFTLSLRGEGPARIRSAKVADFSGLPLGDQLLAATSEPLSIASTSNEREPRNLEILVTVPSALRSTLFSKSIQVRLEGNGLAESKSITIPPPTSDNKEQNERVSFTLAQGYRGTATMTLLVENSIVFSREVDLTPLPTPLYEVKSHSIEDFGVVERNGELAVYSLVGAEGLSRGPSGAALPVETVMLAVGNGLEWPVNERLLRTSRNTPWLDAGATAFGAGRIIPNTYGYFTTIGSDGTESLGATLGINSLRLATSAKNPVWFPTTTRGAAAPLWRGNAFFDLNGSKMIVGLQKPPGGKAFARALASPLETRWVDFGALPLPGLDESNSWLSSFTDGGKFFLIAGPHVQLFSSDSLLRDWKPGTLRVPEGWEKLQAIRWDNQLWLFGIVRRNGRGVVSWMPLRVVEGGFEAVEDFTFSPTPLRKAATSPAPGIPMPIAPNRENETNVR
ncbi:hypothetical protein IT570_03990 [Candidatus Sumerlaeota bacterium]|nr:hypothetical protein [Candidatus Sumerlaeota bacterium]